jgi:hypothetical protein
MTSKASDCAFYGNAFCSSRSAAKNRKMFVVDARVNHNNKLVFHYACLVRW